jgi:hypothetical protein
MGIFDSANGFATESVSSRCESSDLSVQWNGREAHPPIVEDRETNKLLG